VKQPVSVLQLGIFPPPWGGVQTNLVAIRDYLRQQEVPAGVISLSRYRRENSDEVYYPHGALEVLLLLWKLPYRILHMHIGGTETPRLLALGLLCSWLPGHRSVLTFHSGGYPSSKAGKAAKPASLTGFVFRRFDHVISVNPEIAHVMLRYGVKPERLSTIRPDAAHQAPISPQLPERLRNFSEAHSPLLLTVVLLEPEYDVTLQIETLGAIRQDHPEAGLLIIGSGSLEAELRQKIAEQPWSGHILLAGDVPHPDTMRAIQDADMLLRTTLYDGDAVSVREALHLGTPVIATDTGLRPPGVVLMKLHDPVSLRAAVSQVWSSRGVADGSTSRSVDVSDGLRRLMEVYQRLP
jgi:glycogen synthase